MKSLLVDNSLWDLCLDAAGNLAVATDPYARAQDVACAIRLFLGELWYDNTAGVPYFQQILGRTPSIEVFKGYIVEAALSVQGVVSATCEIESLEGRTVTGTVEFTDEDGETNSVSIS